MMSNESFTICHTAKDVTYCIVNFRIKNKDEIPSEL